jgi:hypothetical protein
MTGIVPQRRFPSEDVLAVLADLFLERNRPPTATLLSSGIWG